MRLNRTISLAALALLFAVAPAYALTPTPTPLPRLGAPVGAALKPMVVRLLADAATPVVSAPVAVAYYPKVAVQVNVTDGTCSSFSLSVQGQIDGGRFVTIGSAITQANAGAGASFLVDVSTPRVQFIQVNLTAATSCTIHSVYLFAGP